MQDIRNIAIIAHVDHGKTTLVDRMIYQANLVRRPEDLGNLILDNNDLERERGITILAKNVSVTYKGVKINIIDTPGHSDFGGEVERVLNMADGVLLLVDAFEGCMPQTRFVLNKALDMGKKPIVVINKVDKPNCRPDEVQEEVFELMFNLGATEDQLDFKTVYGSAKQGWMSQDWRKPTNDITALLDTILEEIPAPAVVEGTPQMLVSSLEYSPYVGRIAVGRVTRGTLKTGMPVSLCKRYDIIEKSKIKQVMVFEGLGKANVDEVQCGDVRDRRHHRRHREPGAAPADRRRRAHDVHALHDQQLPVLRQGRQVRDLPPHQGAPGEGAREEPRPPRQAGPERRFLRGLRPRRPAPVRAHRDDAP